MPINSLMVKQLGLSHVYHKVSCFKSVMLYLAHAVFTSREKNWFLKDSLDISYRYST